MDVVANIFNGSIDAIVHCVQTNLLFRRAGLELQSERKLLQFPWPWLSTLSVQPRFY